MKNYQTVKRIIALGPSAAATATAAGVVDGLGADYVTIELAVGAAINTNAAAVVVKIQESDDNVASNFVDINTTTLQKSIALSTTAGQVAAFHVNMNGTRKRYLRLFATPGTVVSNSAVLLTAIANVELGIRPAVTTGQADVVAIG